nr:MAG TPA: hypothetical protein [Caudoviricetes sp.]
MFLPPPTPQGSILYSIIYLQYKTNTPQGSYLYRQSVYIGRMYIV